ncbi:universal stress protein [Halocatena halophila]|uniref:universal stress protein n=1 Tax=Halocatena halophila TaxID=2814576 RepID=UPI002ED16081
MEIDTVLVALADDIDTERVVDHGVGLAQGYDATLHLLLIVDHGRTDPEAVGNALLERAHDCIDESAIDTTHSLMYGFSTEQLRLHPGSVVLDVRSDIGADLVVVPRVRAPAVLGEVADYVVRYASTPVVTV